MINTEEVVQKHDYMCKYNCVGVEYIVVCNENFFHKRRKVFKFSFKSLWNDVINIFLDIVFRKTK